MDTPLQQHLARRAARLTGGLGRPLQFLLRAVQRRAVGRRHQHRSRRSVDEELQAAMKELDGMSDLKLRITWEGPASDAAELPASMQRRDVQRRLVRLFARLLLLDTPFPTEMDVLVGDARVKLTDAAVVLGLSYAPAVSTPVDASSSSASRLQRLHLVAGDWLVSSLRNDPQIVSDPGSLATVSFLDAMRAFGGTMRGRPFELLCVDALCARSLLRGSAPSTTPLRGVWPHLADTALAGAPLPRLSVVAMPKVTVDAAPLSAAARSELLGRPRSRWQSGKLLHPNDVPWVLATWLPVGVVGVPADAQSGSQDFVVRLQGGVIGVANKAVKATNGTGWAAIRDEIAKAPGLHAEDGSLVYVLVLWSLNLAAEVKRALGDNPAATFRAGSWFASASGELARLPLRGSSDVALFAVPEGMELVIANPHAPTGGGLAEVLGKRILVEARAATEERGVEVLGDVAKLEEWLHVERS
jgi:hypothetical protein